MMTPERIAPYILRALAEAQIEGRMMDLEALSRAIEVRRPDVRRAVSALHQEGLVDALRLRLSMQGFAIGSALLEGEMRKLERPKVKAGTNRASAA